jgi:sugar transferase (PEP-CTERM/EpsH1 system associated)
MKTETRPPLIAHIIYRLDYGGLENGLVNLINNMPENRYRHAIICLAGYSDFRNRIARSDVAVYSIDKRPGKDFPSYLRLVKLLWRLRPSVVHSRNFGTIDLQWMAAMAGVRHRVHGEHGWDARDPRGLDRRCLRIRRFCRPVIQRYVAMSQDIGRWLEDTVAVEKSRVRQIYSGVNITRFNPAGELPSDLPWPAAGPEKPVVLGTVARLDPIKNQQALLEAFASLVGRLLPGGLRLIIAGDGPLRGQLETYARELGIADLVWFTGSRDDVPALMRAMDVFVLPSLNEGISNTILEAMACGLPVVAGRVGGNPELLGGAGCGALYEGGAEGLAAALVPYIENGGLRAEEGVHARRRVENNFSLPAMVRGYLQLYDDLILG